MNAPTRRIGRHCARQTRCFTSSSTLRASYPFTFHVGASFAGKPTSDMQRRARSRHPGFPDDHPLGRWRDAMLARPKAVRSFHAGEDFYFVQQMRGASGMALGVADGVGGWISSGVDPSKFSQALMYHCARHSSSSWAGEPPSDPIDWDMQPGDTVEGGEMTPHACLELAHTAVLGERAIEAGSSTATIMTLNAQNGLLRAANLGDSGFLILRSGSVLYHQPPQTHFFNCPCQLSKWPLYMSDRTPQGFNDSPRSADPYSTSLRTGDILILFSDGVSDNVFNTEMQSLATLVSRQMASGSGPAEPETPAAEIPAVDSDSGPSFYGTWLRKAYHEDSRTDEARTAQAIADRLIEYSVACMWKKDRVSPFERAAARAGQFWSGGKPDDATAVVAIVSEGV